MAVSIGTVSCTFVHRGAIRNQRERGEMWAVPGVDGYGARKLGLGDSEFGFQAILFGTPAAVKTWYEAIEALQMTIVDIVDDWGETHSDCMIHSPGGVGTLDIRARANHDGNGTAVGRCWVRGRIWS